jgi:ribosome biogenesis GTPase
MTATIDISLPDLGWRQFFQAQLGEGEIATTLPVRVVGVERNTLIVAGLPSLSTLHLPQRFIVDGEISVTVGDWLLVDAEQHVPVRVLDRIGVFQRKAAGSGRQVQLIAANVDTLFVVTSADEDFNVARIERYLALAREGNAYAVVVISKADLNEDVQSLAARVSALGVLAETVDTRDANSVAMLKTWCGTGQTVAVVGSSGVGKSTLVNTLAGTQQATQDVRESDSKGRHTTTTRSMHRLPAGGWLLDTPGMRELQLFDAGDALEEVFSEISERARSCRFGDCSHEAEPGCAVRAAIDEGRIDPERLKRMKKLQSENYRHSASLAERHARDRSQGKLYKSVQQYKRDRKRSD